MIILLFAINLIFNTENEWNIVTPRQSSELTILASMQREISWQEKLAHIPLLSIDEIKAQFLLEGKIIVYSDVEHDFLILKNPAALKAWSIEHLAIPLDIDPSDHEAFAHDFLRHAQRHFHTRSTFPLLFKRLILRTHLTQKVQTKEWIF